MRLETGSDHLIAQIDGHIGWMTFDNPAKHNALSVSMAQAAGRAIQRFESSDDVRVVVIRGGGDRSFVSGNDISEFDDKRTALDAREQYDAAMREAWKHWDGATKPIIAMINGYCLGGGLILALRADIRICSDASQFGIPAARVGLGYKLASVEQLLRYVNPASAAQILYTGRRFPAIDALRMGLVNQVVAPEELEATVTDMAAQIAANAPLTIRACKAAIAEVQAPEAERDPERIGALVEACFRSNDYREGTAAFREKRTPVFNGE
ncbi:MAG: enoyl-CoA hydratase [Chloroflexota bacterium]